MTRETVRESIATRERASATPTRSRNEAGAARNEHSAVARDDRTAAARDVSVRVRGARPSPEETRDAPAVSLRDQQTWFAEAVMAPDARLSAAEAARLLTPGPQLDALARLDVYRHAYHARLAECLADDYPALQAALGEDAFARVARAYAERHPSTSPSLNAFGRHMAEFCAIDAAFPALEAVDADRVSGADTEVDAAAVDAPAGAPPRRFLADLAALEWAIVEVIHAPSAEPLTLAGLADVPMDAWARARLVPTPALRLLRFDYPVNAFFQAFRRDERPAVPPPSAAATAVYRSGPTLWRMDLTEPMIRLLEALVGGASLGDALMHAVAEGASVGAAASQSDDTEAAAAARVMRWFREWVSSGLFSRVDFA